MIGDKVRIIKRYCADDVYVGLKGVIIKEWNDMWESRRIKVEIPENDKRYYLGNTIIFPLRCLEKLGKKKRIITGKSKICQCTKPEFRWFMEDEKWTGILVCRKCLKPKHKKDLEKET